MLVIPMLIVCGLCTVLLAVAPITPTGKILIVACVPVGGVAGYFLGVTVACVIFDGGNLCGLWGVFITGPLGSLAGGVSGWLFFRRRFATP